MNVHLTIEIEETDFVFEKLSNVEKFSMDKFLTERKLSLNYDQEKILNLLSTELNIKNTDVIFRFYHNINLIIILFKKLQENNHQLQTVFIPSSVRLSKLKDKDLDFASKHANWASFATPQIEEGYQEWIKIYDEIKKQLPKYAIEVKEV